MKRWWVGLVWCVFIAQGAMSAERSPLTVVSYNTENFFYPERDSLNPDTVFTPDGERRWTYSRYVRKTENIARVLTHIGGWEGADIIGLQEVESRECAERLCHVLRRGEYDFVHRDSPDSRGIDVALVYKKARVEVLAAQVYPVDLGEQTTRDILYVCGRVDRKDTLHLLVCHLPSQRGGAAASEWKRVAAKQVVQAVVDSILATHAQAKIVVMGDMNGSPKEDLVGLKNQMAGWEARGKGTHKYHGRWSCLDQFYSSPALDSLVQAEVYEGEWIMEPDERYMGLRPKRTYEGIRYNAEGFSDHLPIVLRWGN